MAYNGVRKHNKKNKVKYKSVVPPKYSIQNKPISSDAVKSLVESDNKNDGSGMIKCMTCGKLMRNPFGSNVKGTINMNCTHCGHVAKKQKEWDDDGTTTVEKSQGT